MMLLLAKKGWPDGEAEPLKESRVAITNMVCSYNLGSISIS
jgi:hypothetical protein